MTLHKARAQPSQGVADWPSVGAFLKTVLSTCPAEAVLKVSNAQRWCKEEAWPPGQVAMPVSLTSGPPTPNLQPEHRLTPPIPWYSPQQKV
jgi:hypothetical protein